MYAPNLPFRTCISPFWPKMWITLFLSLSRLASMISTALSGRNFQRIVGFRKRVKLTVVADIWSESDYGGNHFLIFKFTYFTWKFEKFECFIESYTFDGLISVQRGENRFFFFFRLADLGYRSEFADFYGYLSAGFRIDTQNTFPNLTFGVFKGAFTTGWSA